MTTGSRKARRTPQPTPSNIPRAIITLGINRNPSPCQFFLHGQLQKTNVPTFDLEEQTQCPVMGFGPLVASGDHMSQLLYAKAL